MTTMLMEKCETMLPKQQFTKWIDMYKHSYVTIAKKT